MHKEEILKTYVDTFLISFQTNSQEGMKISTRVAETSESFLIAADNLKLIIAFPKTFTLVNHGIIYKEILKTCQKYQRCRSCNG